MYSHDYADTKFSNFAIEPVFACSFGAQVESFMPKKNVRKSRDTVPLTLHRWKEFHKTGCKYLLYLFDKIYGMFFPINKDLIDGSPSDYNLTP